MMRFLKNLDIVILSAISASSIVIVALDLFNVFDKIDFFKNIDYALLAVLLLALIGLRLVLTSLGQNDFLERFPLDVDRIITSLDGVHIEVFASAVEQDKYLAKRIKAAKKEVCDLSWKERISAGYALKSRVRSTRTYESSIKTACEKVVYREVFVFSDERRKEKLKRRLAENKVGYSCRYFSGQLATPRLQFVLIDGEEIIFASSAYPKLCAIKHKALSEIFGAYYNEVWNAAIPIKDGDVINQEEVDKVFQATVHG